MAFEDGLHNRVDIYPAVRKEGNRTEKDQLKNEVDSILRNIRCRIIHNEKALFEPNIDLASGDRLVDLASGASYEVLKVRKIYGTSKLHHLSCDLKEWGLNGSNQNRNR